MAEWRKAIGARPNNWQAYGDMGRALYQGARYAEAREVLELLTKLQPDNLIGLQMLGTVYHALGDTDAALATYERATAIAPAAQVLSNIGTIHYQRGAYGQARDAYRRALELRPKSAQTHRNLGDSLARLGEVDEARRAYRTAADLLEAESRSIPRARSTSRRSPCISRKRGTARQRPRGWEKRFARGPRTCRFGTVRPSCTRRPGGPSRRSPRSTARSSWATTEPRLPLMRTSSPFANSRDLRRWSGREAGTPLLRARRVSPTVVMYRGHSTARPRGESIWPALESE